MRRECQNTMHFTDGDLTVRTDGLDSVNSFYLSERLRDIYRFIRNVLDHWKELPYDFKVDFCPSLADFPL